MQFDFKKTTWERITVSKKDEAKVLKLIKSGKITDANAIFEYSDGAECEQLTDTDEQMIVKDNKGFATIDVLDDEGNSIFVNGKRV